MDYQQTAVVIVILALLWIATTYAIAKGIERKYPPIGKFISVKGVQLHYTETGVGPVIGLLHGNTVMLQDFTTRILETLSKDFRVIAFDRPGFGYSNRPRTNLWGADKQSHLLNEALHELGVESSWAIPGERSLRLPWR